MKNIRLWLALSFLAAAVQVQARASLITGRFSLTDARSSAAVTQHSYDGKARLVFFGFTHCPLTCPLGMNTLDSLLKAMGPDAAKVQALFITIDPKRDNAAAIKAYLAGHDPRVAGLTGSPVAIAHAMQSFRLEAERMGNGQNYVLEHPAIIYVLDAKGAYLGTIPSRGETGELMKELQKLGFKR